MNALVAAALCGFLFAAFALAGRSGRLGGCGACHERGSGDDCRGCPLESERDRSVEPDAKTEQTHA